MSLSVFIFPRVLKEKMTLAAINGLRDLGNSMTLTLAAIMWKNVLLSPIMWKNVLAHPSTILLPSHSDSDSGTSQSSLLTKYPDDITCSTPVGPGVNDNASG